MCPAALRCILFGSINYCGLYTSLYELQYTAAARDSYPRFKKWSGIILGLIGYGYYQKGLLFKKILLKR